MNNEFTGDSPFVRKLQISLPTRRANVLTPAQFPHTWAYCFIVAGNNYHRFRFHSSLRRMQKGEGVLLVVQSPVHMHTRHASGGSRKKLSEHKHFSVTCLFIICADGNVEKKSEESTFLIISHLSAGKWAKNVAYFLLSEQSIVSLLLFNLCMKREGDELVERFRRRVLIVSLQISFIVWPVAAFVLRLPGWKWGKTKETKREIKLKTNIVPRWDLFFFCTFARTVATGDQCPPGWPLTGGRLCPCGWYGV